MELRDIELFDKRIRNNLMVNDGRGVNMNLSREETLLILRLLDKEISIRRLTDTPKPQKTLREQWEESKKGGK